MYNCGFSATKEYSVTYHQKYPSHPLLTGPPAYDDNWAPTVTVLRTSYQPCESLPLGVIPVYTPTVSANFYCSFVLPPYNCKIIHNVEYVQLR